MASTSIPSKSHLLFLLFFFTLILLVQSKLSLDPSDFEALLLIQKDLGIHGQRRSQCNSARIFCEWRFTNNSYVLKVTRLVFESQNLNGKISPAIGKFSEIKVLSLENNKLSSKIPTEILHCQRLEILNIRKNQFSGEVPEGISSLIRLRVLDISSNKFSGNLKFLKNSPNLEKLVLADNMFVGKVPLSLRSFRNLRSINISGNTLLEGPLPVMNQLEHLSSETIPNRYILAEKSIERNHTSARAMAPSSSKGLNGSQAEAPATTRHKHKKTKRKVPGSVVGFLAGAFAGSLSGLVFSLLFKFITFLNPDQRPQEGESLASPLINVNVDDVNVDVENSIYEDDLSQLK